MKIFFITRMFLFSGILAIIIAGGCSKKEEPAPVPAPTLSVLSTSPAASITTNSAESGGTISSDGGAAVTGRGICWSLYDKPTTADMKTAAGTGTGSFTGTMTNLLADTVYYVKAYAVNSAGTAYGNLISFRTGKIIPVTVKDVDDNIYTVVSIGTQKWLGSNLRVTHYRNGDAIAKVTGDNAWKTLATGAYCSYDNLDANISTYGGLYNWHALNDSRGLCPTGWHIPSDGEWATLGAFLGGNSTAGGKLKATGTIEGGTGLWYAPNTDATNTSGFNAIPGGYRINYGTYYSIGNVA